MIGGITLFLHVTIILFQFYRNIETITSNNLFPQWNATTLTEEVYLHEFHSRPELVKSLNLTYCSLEDDLDNVSVLLWNIACIFMHGICWDKVLKTKYKYLYKNSFYNILYFTIESDIDKVFWSRDCVWVNKKMRQNHLQK